MVTSDDTAAGDGEPVVAAADALWSVDQIEALVDHLPVMIAYWDRSAHNVFVNRAYVDWFGDRPVSQIRGKHARDLLGPTAWTRVRSYVRAVLAGETIEYDSTLQDARGRTRHIQTVYIPNAVDSGVAGFYTLGIDITERVTAHAVERESAEQVATFVERERIADELHNDVIQRLFAAVLDLEKPSAERIAAAAGGIQDIIGDLRSITVPNRTAQPEQSSGPAVPAWTASELVAILDHMPANLGFLDNEFRIRFVNKSGAAYFGRRRRKMIGRQVCELFEPEQYARVLPHLQAAVNGSPESFDSESRDRHGRVWTYRTTLIPNVVGDEVDGLFVYAVDLAGQVDAEARLIGSAARIAELEQRLRLAEAEVERLRSQS